MAGTVRFEGKDPGPGHVKWTGNAQTADVGGRNRDQPWSYRYYEITLSCPARVRAQLAFRVGDDLGVGRPSIYTTALLTGNQGSTLTDLCNPRFPSKWDRKPWDYDLEWEFKMFSLPALAPSSGLRLIFQPLLIQREALASYRLAQHARPVPTMPKLLT